MPVSSRMRDATQSNSTAVRGCRGLVPRSLPDPEQMILLIPWLPALRVVMLPCLPSSELISGDGRQGQPRSVHHQYCRSSLTPPSPSLAWLALVWLGEGSSLQATAAFSAQYYTPHLLSPGIASHWLPSATDFASSSSVQQENAAGTAAHVQRRMCDLLATSLHDILLGQASIKHSLSTQQCSDHCGSPSSQY